MAKHVMSDEFTGMMASGAGQQVDNGPDARCRLELTERIGHLQRRISVQRRIIEKLAAGGASGPDAAMAAMIEALAELEERNLTLEDAIRAVRATGAGPAEDAATPLPLQTAVVPQGVPESEQPDLEGFIRAGRLEAEELRAARDYKRARQVLRRVASRQALKGIGLQLLANSRYRVVRKLFRFYRYG
jgi:hypothetical protein